MTALAAMVLADARFPGGGHAHSGGVEEAVARGLVHDVDDLGAFLDGRLATAGLVAAAFAARSAELAARTRRENPPRGCAELAGLDGELDARTPSAAQRAASRAQGRAALRAARPAWPSPELDALVAVHPRPHHPLLVGVVVGEPLAAARCVAYLAVSGPASAAVRLLGLDPLAVNAVVAGLPVETIAEQALGGLAALGSPVLDLMAEAHVAAGDHRNSRHHREQVRLFVS